MPLSIEAKAGLHEVLLQAALRAERLKANQRADELASELARRQDQHAKEAR
ncbi:ribonuclease HI [Bradyrhizobium sp. USDA 4472]